MCHYDRTVFRTHETTINSNEHNNNEDKNKEGLLHMKKLPKIVQLPVICNYN